MLVVQYLAGFYVGMDYLVMPMHQGATHQPAHVLYYPNITVVIAIRMYVAQRHVWAHKMEEVSFQDAQPLQHDEGIFQGHIIQVFIMKIAGPLEEVCPPGLLSSPVKGVFAISLITKGICYWEKVLIYEGKTLGGRGHIHYTSGFTLTNHTTAGYAVILSGAKNLVFWFFGVVRSPGPCL